MKTPRKMLTMRIEGEPQGEAVAPAWVRTLPAVGLALVLEGFALWFGFCFPGFRPIISHLQAKGSLPALTRALLPVADCPAPYLIACFAIGVIPIFRVRTTRGALRMLFWYLAAGFFAFLAVTGILVYPLVTTLAL